LKFLKTNIYYKINFNNIRRNQNDAKNINIPALKTQDCRTKKVFNYLLLTAFVQTYL